jgi:hypothetical protein
MTGSRDAPGTRRQGCLRYEAGRFVAQASLPAGSGGIFAASFASVLQLALPPSDIKLSGKSGFCMESVMLYFVAANGKGGQRR